MAALGRFHCTLHIKTTTEEITRSDLVFVDRNKFAKFTAKINLKDLNDFITLDWIQKIVLSNNYKTKYM